MLIEEKAEVEGDPGEVWERLSSVERIPEFWHGTRSLEILERRVEGAVVERVRARMKFAFGGSGMVEITVDRGNKTVVWNYVSGPFKGTQTVRVVGKAVEVRWSIRFNGIYRLTSSWTAGHFKSGTRHALERLCSETAPRGTVSQA